MPRYVIQQHHATSMHFDFRLEVAGTFRSWAVPKGPSLDPRDKRLAMAVDDHSLSWGDFEGVIPEGEYGAGPVIVWDRGTYENLRDEPMEEALDGRARVLPAGRREAAGRLVAPADRGPPLAAREAARRRGRRRRPGGRAARVGRQRAHDRGARQVIEPMKAVLSDKPFSDPDWIFERKLDGIRCLAHAGRLRRPADVAHRPPDERRVPRDRRGARARAGRGLHRRRRAGGLRRDGITSFSRLQQPHRERVPVFLYLFDLPAPRRRGPARVPLRERKARLRRALELRRPGPLQPSPQGRARRGAVPRGLPEGPRGRDRQARRQPLPRRPLARLAQAQVPRRAGARDRRLHGAEGLAHRVRRAARGLLRGRRRCATPARSAPASTSATLRELGARLRELERDESPFEPFKPVPPGTHWVRPELVGQIGFSEWTRDGRLRHPRYLGLRDDKPAREVVRERAVVGPSRSPTRTSCCSPTTASRRPTSPAYYERVAEWMLPHIKGRPDQHAALPRRDRRQGLLPQGHARLLPRLAQRVEVPKRGGTVTHVSPATPRRSCTSSARTRSRRTSGSRAPTASGSPTGSWSTSTRPRRATSARSAAPPAVPASCMRELGFTPFAQVTGSKGMHVWTPLRRRAGIRRGARVRARRRTGARRSAIRTS